MRREDIEKLLGGWAAGTLTDAERTALLQAALEDQNLFDQLMAEEPLREALADPVLRRRVARALDEPEPRRFGWFKRPWAWGLAGSLAATAVMVVALVQWNRAVRPETKTAEVRMAKTAPPQQPTLEIGPQIPPARGASAAGETKSKQKESRRVRAFEARDAAAPKKERSAEAAMAGRADTAHGLDLAARALRRAPQMAAPAQIAEPPALAPATPVPVQREAQGVVGGAPGMVPQTAPATAPLGEPGLSAPPQSAAFMRQPVVAREGARALFERAETDRTKTAAAPAPRRAGATYVMMSPPADSLGLRYRVLSRAAAGDWIETDPDRRYKPDAALRLEISVNERAYYYVIIRDAVLASGLVSQAETQTVPIPRGTTRVTLIASRVPIAAPLEARRPGAQSLVEKSGGSVYVAKTSFVPDSQVTAEIVLRYEE